MKLEHVSEFQTTTKAISTLIIGDLGRWKSEGRDTSSANDFSFLSLAELTEGILSQIAPDIILSPLIADEFDAIDVAEVLARLQYQGCYRALASSPHNGRVIKDEVAAIAPALNFDILTIT